MIPSSKWAFAFTPREIYIFFYNDFIPQFCSFLRKRGQVNNFYIGFEF